MAGSEINLHTKRPAVYLDQWVWIRLAQARVGRPERPSHTAVLAAIEEASADGIAFPLSTTHYLETLQLTDPRQRRDLADVMAPISAMCTLRRRTDLVHHQILNALHEVAGRPLFKPTPPTVLGLGVSWAFRGVPAHFHVVDSDGSVSRDADPTWVRHINQYSEAAFLAGPADDEVEALRSDGYRTVRELDADPDSRLAWEQRLKDKLKDEPVSRPELRVRLLARELRHEYETLLSSILIEYRLTLDDIAKSANPRKSRPHAVAFAELVPTLRISAEMKLEIDRNQQRPWTWNMLRDIDALAVAVPYCRVVVADHDAAVLVRRGGADERHKTTVVSDLNALPELLQDLRAQTRDVGDDPNGWDEIGPGQGFRLDSPLQGHRPQLPHNSQVRMLDPDGSPSLHHTGPTSDATR